MHVHMCIYMCVCVCVCVCVQMRECDACSVVTKVGKFIASIKFVHYICLVTLVYDIVLVHVHAYM